MILKDWRIATRRKGAAPGWDVGKQPMLKDEARRAAEDFNHRYKAYEHKAVRVPTR